MIFLLLIAIPFFVQAMGEKKIDQLNHTERLRGKRVHSATLSKLNISMYRENGFYDSKNSSENTRSKPQAIPEQKKPCFYCREAQKSKLSFTLCSECRSMISEVLIKQLTLNNHFGHTVALELGMFNFLNKIIEFTKTNYTDMFIENTTIAPEDKKLIYTAEEAEQLIEYIFKKYEIFSDAGTPVLKTSSATE